MVRNHTRHGPRFSTEKPTHKSAFSQPSSSSSRRVKRATHTRRIWSFLSSLLLFIALVFLIMIEIGNIHNKPVLRNIWFINLNVSNVIPDSIPNAAVLNTIAQTLGLHDFYQVGLWGYCEGYDNQGVTDCTTPKALYWFDPVSIIQEQLLAGSSIQLPQNITSVLHLIKIASKIMFGFFLTGTCLTFLLIFITPLSVISRWIAFVNTILTLFNAALIMIASAIGTAMFTLMQDKFQTAIPEVNIEAKVGKTMFAFTWVATLFAVLAWLIQFSLMCCCTSTRDVKRKKAHA